MPNWPALIFFYPFAAETAGTWQDMAIERVQDIDKHMTTIAE